MVRSVMSVVVGAVVWMVVFLCVTVSLAQFWPEYAAHGRVWFQQHVYEFTTGMSVVNASFWVLSEIVAGALAVLIAARRQAGWVLASVIGLYLAYEHLYVEWSNLPWWYNLAVAIPAAPAVLLGGRLAGRRAARPAF
jgi:multisubunit Na+/H+ antiporter MnhB subunit